jgi:pSer/pThr/pTyr-binding forkhead associated (FHA) protein
MLVGRDVDAQIQVADAGVEPRHAMIERRGNSWLVSDLQTANPSRLVDAAGSINPLSGETTIQSGQLLVGSVLITLYPGRS